MAVSKFIRMTGNKYLLDTNIITAWLKGDLAIAEKIDAAEDVCIPIIVIGELYYGAMYSTQVEKNVNNITSITSNYNILSINERTTLEYGIIKAELRKIGRPIPENDIWIASIAKCYEFIIVTRDNHFNEIKSIQSIKW